MIDLIKKGNITASFKNTDKTANVNGQQVPLATLVKAGNWDVLANFGLFKREKQNVDLKFNERIASYDLQVIDGKTIDMPKIVNLTPDELTEKVKEVKAEAVQSIIDYADEVRGLLVIGSTSLEREGWAIKSDIANRHNLGQATDADLAAIDLEISNRGLGETQDELAILWLTKSARYASAVCMVDGFESNGTKQINEAKVENIPNVITALLKAAEAAKAQLFG